MSSTRTNHRVMSQTLLACASLALAAAACGQEWQPLEKIVAPPGWAGAGDYFGASVAISGDTMVIGAYYDDIGGRADQGSAQVFRWTGSAWEFESTLVASDGAAGDFFGLGVSLSGGTAVIGALYDDVGGHADQGSAYIFVRSGNVWTERAKLTAEDGQAGDYFGYATSIDGNTVVVGARQDDGGRGSAYMFTGSGSDWMQQAKLTASDGAAGDLFGFAVDVSGSTALVAAEWADSQRGAAYVFVRDAGVWTQQAKLVAPDRLPVDMFGASVALSGETAVVCAHFDDMGNNVDQGSAYVFVRSDSKWTLQAHLTPAEGQTHQAFGISSDIDSDMILIGAYIEDVGPNWDQGAAYVFTRSGDAWEQIAHLIAPDGEAGQLSGTSVALGEGVAVVGARGDDVDFVDQGSAWAFVPRGECYADLDGSYSLDLFDYLTFLNLFNAADPKADCTGDGLHDLSDFVCYTDAFKAGC